MWTLTLVAGPNGSGKSTITSRTSFEGSNCVIDPDAIARHLDPEQPARAAITAARQAVEKCRSMLQRRESFVVESTLAGNGAIALLREAKRSDFRTELIFVALGDPEMHVERVRLRVAQGGHHVPDDDVRRRYWRSLKRAPEAMKLVDQAAVFDNSGMKPVRMLLAERGQIVWRTAEAPPWVLEIATAVGLELPVGHERSTHVE